MTCPAHPEPKPVDGCRDCSTCEDIIAVATDPLGEYDLVRTCRLDSVPQADRARLAKWLERSWDRIKGAYV